MGNRVIALGRQFGSGGREIGRKLSDALGFGYYDRELISLAAQRAEVDERVFEEKDEKASSPWLFKGFYDGGPRVQQGQSAEDVLFQMQSEVILELAAKENCIIVGRCADYILQDKADCLKVFIHADMKFRAERIVKVYGEREQSPEDRLLDKDKRRVAYHRFYTNMKWGHAQNYHLTLDSGVIGIDKCVDIIAELY